MTFVQLVVSTLKSFRVPFDDTFCVRDVSGDTLRCSSAVFVQFLGQFDVTSLVLDELKIFVLPKMMIVLDM